MHWTMHVQSSLSILEKHVCVVHVRSSRARCRGQFIGVRIINNSIIVWLISIRIDAELKEVHGETRPRGDVCLVTPKGPSASTLESLEKALQTVGRICFLLCLRHFFDSFSFRLPPSPEIERAFQTVRLFETFYSSEINLLARAIETVHFNDKECVYRQGDPGDYYYLILKGRVDCQMQVCVFFRCL